MQRLKHGAIVTLNENDYRAGFSKGDKLRVLAFYYPKSLIAVVRQGSNRVRGVWIKLGAVTLSNNTTTNRITVRSLDYMQSTSLTLEDKQIIKEYLDDKAA